MELLKKLGIKPHDPAIPLLHTHPEETKIEKTLVRQRSLQPCLQQQEHGGNLDAIDRWVDKEEVVHVHNGTLLSHKKEHVWVSSNGVDEPRAYSTEWSKSEREG